MRKIILIIVLIFVGINSSCKKNQGGTTAAKDYCNCMKEYGAPKDFLYAQTICNAELIKKYRLYRLARIELNDYSTQAKISYATKDSVGKFMKEYLDYLYDQCCKPTALCNDTSENKK